MSPEIISQSGELRMLLLILTIVAFLIYLTGKSLGLGRALALISIYFVFILYIIGRSEEVEITNYISEYLNQMVQLISIQWL
jgi:cation:H+ antiporter